MAEMDTDDFITAAEAAAILRQKPATLRKRRWRGGGVPFFRPSGPRGRVYYRRSEVIAWIEAGRARSTAEEQVKREQLGGATTRREK